MADEEVTDEEVTDNIALKAETIIVAEDSLPNRKILTHLLEKLGYQVIACINGKEAWDKVNECENINLVAIISDIMMPEEDGLQLLRRIRESEKYKGLPFVLATAVSEVKYIVEAKKLGVSGYILKPLTFRRITAKLQEMFPENIFPKIAS